MLFTGRSRRGFNRTTGGWLGAVALAAALAGSALPAVGEAREAGSGPDAVAVQSLPAEAQATHRLILAGGPFAYRKDGVVFGNRERLLPLRPRGYYREYTVPTPQSRDRGARRIVCGGRQPAAPDACYYTDDHYASFRLIAQ